MPTIADLFDVAYGNKFDMNKMQPATRENGIAFVGRRGGLTGVSGVAGYVEAVAGVKPYPAGLLTVALGGSRLLSTYVQQRPFYTAQNVAVLTPKNTRMPLKTRLFYAMCIRHNAFRYTAFGREANRTLGTIALPDKMPAWAARTPLPTHDGLAKAEAAAKPWRPATGAGWAERRLDSLFDIKKGQRLTKANMKPGATRFIGASEKNNGVTAHVGQEAQHRAGILTVVYNGNSVGFAFYQDEPFLASDDVNVLYPKSAMTKWVQLFIAAVIKHQRNRYTYGYKWTLERMKATEIRVPVTPQGELDTAYMEAFMRGLPFSAAVA